MKKRFGFLSLFATVAMLLAIVGAVSVSAAGPPDEGVTSEVVIASEGVYEVAQVAYVLPGTQRPYMAVLALATLVTVVTLLTLFRFTITRQQVALGVETTWSLTLKDSGLKSPSRGPSFNSRA